MEIQKQYPEILNNFQNKNNFLIKPNGAKEYIADI